MARFPDFFSRLFRPTSLTEASEAHAPWEMGAAALRVACGGGTISSFARRRRAFFEVFSHFSRVDPPVSLSVRLHSGSDGRERRADLAILRTAAVTPEAAVLATMTAEKRPVATWVLFVRPSVGAVAWHGPGHDIVTQNSCFEPLGRASGCAFAVVAFLRRSERRRPKMRAEFLAAPSSFHGVPWRPVRTGLLCPSPRKAAFQE